MQDDPDLRMVARTANTFHLDPIVVLNDYSPVQLAALMAAHNVVVLDQQASTEATRREIERIRQEAGRGTRR